MARYNASLQALIAAATPTGFVVLKDEMIEHLEVAALEATHNPRTAASKAAAQHLSFTARVRYADYLNTTVGK